MRPEEEASSPASKSSGEINPRAMPIEDLQEALIGRLRRRKDTGVFFLDLRSKRWGALGSPVLFDPSDPQWPDGGRTTTHLATAKSWLRSDDKKIAKRVQRQLSGHDLEIFIADAVEEYIDDMHKDPHLGLRHPTVQQRRSYLRNHIVPALGKYRLATLPNEPVQRLIDTMHVRTYPGDGTVKKAPASKASREAVLAALVALFRHVYPDQQFVPWGRVTIKVRKQESAHRKMMVRAGRARELVKKQVYNSSEMRTLLLTSRFLDRRLGGEEYVDILAAWACPNLAPSMALQFGLASRISELVEVREEAIEPEGFALIPGTKSSAAIRYLPIQDSLWPWINLARALKPGIAQPADYLLRTHPRHNELPNATIYARRMAKVQEIAGLKLPGKRSHIYRATHASMATMRGIPAEEIKMILGHSGIFGAATDEYIQFMREMIRPEHRSYLSIPTPEDLDVELDAGWIPPFLPKRRKPTGRLPRG